LFIQRIETIMLLDQADLLQTLQFQSLLPGGMALNQRHEWFVGGMPTTAAGEPSSLPSSFGGLQGIETNSVQMVSIPGANLSAGSGSGGPDMAVIVAVVVVIVVVGVAVVAVYCFIQLRHNLYHRMEKKQEQQDAAAPQQKSSAWYAMGSICVSPMFF
jgi:hypothetical protein